MKLWFRRLRESMMLYYIIGKLTGNIRVKDPIKPGLIYTFPAASRRVVKRARRMHSKEPGTVAWLEANVKEHTVFYDIGANIGIYSVLAAARITPGAGGKVYSFEPAAGSFAALLQVIAANQMTAHIAPLCIALDAEPQRQDFAYRDLLVGGTQAQLSSSPVSVEATQAPIEIKFTQSLDNLVARHGFAPPGLVKIDVDGNELNILRGMRTLLAERKVRSLQIEVCPSLQEEIYRFMSEAGYRLTDSHRSRQIGRRWPDDPVQAHLHNAIFTA